MECAGCLTSLDNGPFLHCTRCASDYHISCMNTTLNDFNAMPQEFRANWICVLCRSKERKGGDNTNTPIRGVLPPSPQYNNVTLRSKIRSTTASANCSCLSADSMRDIIREELLELFNHQFLPQLVEVKSTLTSLETPMTNLNTELEKVKVEQDTQADIIRSLRSETETLRANNISLSKRLAQMDQQFRSSNIEIQYVPENKQENLINTVVQLGRVIKCPIDEAKIHYCARLAKMNDSSPRPRSILVKFNSPRLRDEFLAASSRFNKNNRDDKLNTSHLGIGGAKKSAIYVVEHLSPENKGLHAATRKKARELNYKYVWVRDSRIYMRKNDESNYVHIKSIDHLNRLS
ncbi:unnamed protein product [Euphydryas editha]|uniref:PHD-type domain-containing protein n=1 Tax=Euphydryas editha TaxID=104508 RepID=A0AAU9USZ8_EUPED|nr:unnamed protein product [Euphydryas editha]